MEESDIYAPTEGVFGSSGEGRLTPLYLNWEELTYSKVGVKVYEHSGAKPTPRSTFRLRYNSTDSCNHQGIGIRDRIDMNALHNNQLTLFQLNINNYISCVTYSLLCRSEVDPGPAVGESLDSAEAVQSFAATLVPLLLEVWVEASTGDCPWNTSEGAHLLTPDAMSVMFQVLSILQLLRKLAPQQEHQGALVR